jgi:hypothetical protein
MEELIRTCPRGEESGMQEELDLNNEIRKELDTL